MSAELRRENMVQTVYAESQLPLAFHGEFCVHPQRLLSRFTGSRAYLCGIFPGEKYLFCC